MSSPTARLVGTGLILFFLFLSRPITGASESLSIVINEVAWMGTKSSYNNEWIEFYSNRNSEINLAGWKLAAEDGTPEINLSGIIPANGFYLLERTNDDTLPEISADQIYSGALGNSGESLILYDSSGNPIDSVNCSSGWFAGDNLSKQTMERKNPQLEGSNSDNWQTSQNPEGTPKTKNSVFAETEIVDVKPQQPQTEPEPKEEEPKPIIYPAGIVINEILPSPEGPDEKDEWIEIFNQNNFEVDISNWKITDIAGKTETYAFPQITKIPAQGFLVLSRPTTKITLNNDEDGLLLIQPNGNILDSVNYQKALRGQSYNKSPLENDSLTGQAEGNWVWSSVLTPASKNILTQPEIKKEVEEKSETETQKSKDSPETKSQLASIGEQIPKSSKIFLIALGLAIFSGVIILIIKKKLKNASDID